MNIRHFLRYWIPVALLSLGACLLSASQLELRPDAQWLSLALWALYAGLTLLAAWGSLSAMDERNFPRFQSYFMGSLMGKILLTGLIMGVYAYTTEFKTTAVLVPVGLSYLPFLLLETWYLARASRAKDSGPYGKGGSKKSE